LLSLGAQELHLWLSPRHSVANSDQLKRQLLSRYASVAPQDWRFTLGKHGKPGLLNSPQPLDFNLSHSGDWLACVVTAGTPVGLDIEYCDPARDVLKLARRFFQAHEIAALQACGKEEQTARFYDYWTLKEAGIKARGAALGQELESSGFKLDSPAGAEGVTGLTEIRDESGVLASPAYYCLLDPVADYRLAICWLTPAAVLPRLRMFELRGADQPAREFSPSLRAASVPGC
jgi:phosphopantetheine--protein transferase-like protein